MIVVTGASGFIGRRLVPALLAERTFGSALPGSTGSTGCQPVPAGDPPDGMAAPLRTNKDGLAASVPSAVPVGRLPTGAGRLPAPPFFQTASQDFRAAGLGFQEQLLGSEPGHVPIVG